MVRIKPVAAEWEARTRPLCYAAPLILSVDLKRPLFLFSGGETEGEGREPELQHLRDRQRVGQTLGRDGAGNQAALPTGATNWAVTSLGNTYRYYGNALHYSCIIKIANSYCSCPHEIRPKLTHPNHSIQSNVLYQNQLQAIF